MAVARRVYLYGIALVALGMLVAGLAALTEIALELVAEAIYVPLGNVGSDDLSRRVSYSGALIVIGLVTWLIHWQLAERPVRRGDDVERRSGVRKLYLYLVLLLGGLLLAVQARGLIADLLAALFGQVGWSDLFGGEVIPPLATLLAGAPLWVYHARIAARDRALLPEVGAGATLRRWCVYLLSFVGVLVLIFGVSNLVTLLWDVWTPAGASVVGGDNWLALPIAGRVASIVTGLGLWYAAWTWSTAQFRSDRGPDAERDSTLRKVYLYLVLLIAVSWTVWSLGQALYVALRSALLPGEAAGLLESIRRDFGSTVANALAFGVAWLYHARVVEREASAAPEHARQAGIRRIYGYLVALVGVVTFAFGLGGTLDTVLELVFRPGEARPDNWWADRLSLFATLIVVGLPIWLRFWLRLQREVTDAKARRSLARRIYLFLVFGVCVLTLLGSGVFTLYQLLRAVLGDRWTGAQTGDLLEAASAATVVGVLLAYHLRVFRADAAAAPSVASGSGLESVLIVRATDRVTLDALERELRDRAVDGVEIRRADLDSKAAGRLMTP